VEKAAQSLWIPIQGNGSVASILPWHVPAYRPAVVLVGSEPRALYDDSVDPQTLHRAAQLATEVALRWAKRSQAAGSGPERAS
jgi:hypothetical protein